MMILTFFCLYTIYAIIIGLVYLTIILAQYYNSQKLLQFLSSICAVGALYLPIFLKYHLHWTEFSGALVSVFSAATGFLFCMKIIEIAFTYEWETQNRITLRQLLEDFSTFPKYKYQVEPPMSKKEPVCLTLPKFVKYLILNADDEQLTKRQQSIVIMVRGIFQYSVLRVLLHFTPYSVLRLHSQNANFLSISHFLTYNLYGFIFYFSLGMVVNTVFGFMGFIWNIRIRCVYPDYPFLPTSLHDFWSRRWNIYIKSILHRIAFIALPRLTGHKQRSSIRSVSAGICAFLVSGLLHEFMYTVSMDRWSGGKNILFFLVNGMFVGVELMLESSLRRKPLFSPIFGWMYSMIALYFTGFLFCDPWVESDCFTTLKTYLG